MTLAEGYLRFNQPLIGWFVRRLRSREAAQDLAQNVWVIAAQKWVLDQPEKSVGAFLFRAARNEVLWYFERDRRWRVNVVPTLATFGSSTPVPVCRYCGESIRQYADYRSEGVCSMHYNRLRRGADLTKPKAVRHDEAKVLRVRELLRSGMKGKHVAKAVGMSPAQVSRIKNGVQRGAIRLASRSDSQ